MISDNPLVTISIPAYNCASFIQACLRSVYIQTYKNYEIVIVDDCSRDSTIDIIQKVIISYGLENKTKLFSHSINCGCGRTEKHAIEFGTGELVVILDSDDALSDSMALDILVKAHKDNPDASLVYSDFYNCDDKLHPKRLRRCAVMKDSESYLGKFQDGKYIESNIMISHVKCFKRSFYNKTEGVDATLLKAVDKDLVLKLEEVGKFVYIPVPLYYHRLHSSSISNSFKRMTKEERYKINQLRISMYEKAVDRRMKKLNDGVIDNENI
jgi:glycosyltransferase involved in cell wall biosynthesis